MFKGLLVGAFMVVGMAGIAAADVLDGYDGTPNIDPPMRAEDLFQGDLIAEIGIGCSNGLGTSGGPNDIVVGVTAALTPPFDLVSHFYNIFTQVSPTITSLSFIALAGGGTPGAEFARQTGLDFTQGDHTVAINPAISVASAQFFFGHNQAQSNVGMRWGLDTSSGSAATSFIRAPTCGANAFTLVDQLGFPGNWVMSVSTDTGGTPVELSTWGSVKAYNR